MRIYLAGKWEEAAVIKQYADELRFLGHTITMPWFEDHVNGQEDLAQSAIEDEAGIVNAEMAIFIFEKSLPYAGSYTELGIAIALRRRIVIVGPAADRNVFVNHPCVEKVDSWTKLIHCYFLETPPLGKSTQCIPAYSPTFPRP